MNIEYFVWLFSLASTMAWTPGPNNALIAASGARFGYIRSLPHIAGIVVGFAVMQFILWTGLGQVFSSVPILREVLRYLGAAILLWVAYQIATAKRPSDDVKTSDKPWSFWKGAAFQWINPKAWVMSVSIVGHLPKGDTIWFPALVSALIFGLAGVFSANGWALFGRILQSFLSSDLRFRIFCITMGVLIVLTVISILMMDL